MPPEPRGAPGPAPAETGPARSQPAQPEPAEAPTNGTGTDPAIWDAPDAPRPRRTQMSALEIRAMVQQLQSLVGAYVEKAYQPTRDELLLRLRRPGTGRLDLYARRGERVLLATNPPANPTHPSSFAMAIRRHASGGRIYKIEQAGFDRVVTIHVQRRDDEYRIVLELFGEGNILLVRSDGRILLPLVHEAWKTRTLRPGAPYAPPPARDDPTTFDEATFIAKAQEGNRELVRALAREVGLGGVVAEEVVARAGVDKNRPVQETDEATWKQVYAAWDTLRQHVQQGSEEAWLLAEDGRLVDCAPHPSVLMQREADADPDRYRIVLAPTFSQALDRLHFEGRRTVEAKEESRKVDEAKTKLETQREAQEEAIGKFAAQETTGRLHGDLLYAHYQQVEQILEGIHQARREHDWSTILERIEQGRRQGNPDARRIVRIEPKKGQLVVRLEDGGGQEHELALDITKSVTENAQTAYTRSKTARAKLAGAREALKGTLQRLETAREEAQVAAEEAREVAARPKVLIGPERHWWFEGYRWMVASTGELVVSGRDAASNDRLVKKHLAENDRYVHADIHGAPSVLVKPSPGRDDVGEEALEEAGRFAVVYSRAFAQAGSADAYWATPTQVSKTPEAGEFLARGAFIVRGKRNWMRKLPMELAIGRVWLDKEGRPAPAPEDPTNPGPLRAKLLSGAPSAVKTHADRWVVLAPGRSDRRRVTQGLARAFDAHPDPLERLLPPGALRLVTAQHVHVADDVFQEATG